MVKPKPLSSQQTALDQFQASVKAQDFRTVAFRIIAEAREKQIPPVAKQEMDDLWGMNQLDCPGEQ